MNTRGLWLVPWVAWVAWQCGAPQVPQAVGESDAGRAPLPATADATFEAEATTVVLDAASEAAPDASPDAASPAVPDSGATAAADAGVQRKCSQRVLGQSARRAACTRDDHCTLRPAGCCPKCGMLEASEVRAVDTGDDVLCNMGCPQCASGIPGNLKAECVKRRCVVVETVCEGPPPSSCPVVRPERVLPRVLGKELAGCADDRHCKLQTESCCNCGVATGDGIVALNRGKKLACKGPKGCPDCLDEGIDKTYVAVCIAKLCRVKDRGLDPVCSSGLGGLLGQ